MGALKVTHAVRAATEQGDAWRYVAECYFDNHHRWDPAIVGMLNQTGGPVAKGTVGVETRRFLGRQRARFEVTEFDAPSGRFALRNLSGPFDLERAYAITDATEGTVIEFTFVMTPKLPVRAVFPLLRGPIERQVRANIDRLGDLLAH
jgi:hypothetical protein